MSYTKLLYHIVFGTKDRIPYLNSAWRDDMHAYLGGETRGLKGTAFEVGGIEDHVHLLAHIPPTIALADFMSKLKANSSGWAKRKTGRPFVWQPGYGAFTVSESEAEKVKHYIRRQEEHHQKVDYREEFLSLLHENAIEFEEQYLWTP
ncbi:MAG: IS200/IS605 family transposase [Pyrinomonadaceae bacterium]